MGPYEGMDRVHLTPDLLPVLIRLHALYSLRGADSTHLAAAIAYRELSGEPLTFACADAQLCTAAAGEGFQLVP